MTWTQTCWQSVGSELRATETYTDNIFEQHHRATIRNLQDAWSIIIDRPDVLVVMDKYDAEVWIYRKTE